jgi:hypothetical protein
LRDRAEDFVAADVDVTAIGMGRPDMAAHFRDSQEVPFRLLVDHDRETYKALGLPRANLMQVAGPTVWVRAAKGLLTGKGVAPAKQDPFQLGGTVVVDVGGSVLFLHRSTDASDNAAIDDVLGALPHRA